MAVLPPPVTEGRRHACHCKPQRDPFESIQPLPVPNRSRSNRPATALAHPKPKFERKTREEAPTTRERLLERRLLLRPPAPSSSPIYRPRLSSSSGPGAPSCRPTLPFLRGRGGEEDDGTVAWQAHTTTTLFSHTPIKVTQPGAHPLGDDTLATEAAPSPHLGFGGRRAGRRTVDRSIVNRRRRRHPTPTHHHPFTHPPTHTPGTRLPPHTQKPPIDPDLTHPSPTNLKPHRTWSVLRPKARPVAFPNSPDRRLGCSAAQRERGERQRTGQQQHKKTHGGADHGGIPAQAGVSELCGRAARLGGGLARGVDMHAYMHAHACVHPPTHPTPPQPP